MFTMNRATVFGILFLFSSVGAFAQTKPTVPIGSPGAGASAPHQQPKTAENMCAPDLKKFCSEVKPGEGRLLDCAYAHSKDLKPDCRALVSGLEDNWARLAAANHETVAQYKKEMYAEKLHYDNYVKTHPDAPRVIMGKPAATGTSAQGSGTANTNSQAKQPQN